MNTCMFCYKSGTPRIGTDKADFGEVSVCDYCWKLLRDPKTALPLIRGHLTLTERGRMPAAQLKGRIDAFMDKVKDWKPKN